MIFYEGDKVAWTEPKTQKTYEAKVISNKIGFPEVYFINVIVNGKQRCIGVQPSELKKINKNMEDK